MDKELYIEFLENALKQARLLEPKGNVSAITRKKHRRSTRHKPHVWSKEQKAFILDHPNYNNLSLATHLGLRVSQVENMRYKLLKENGK